MNKPTFSKADILIGEPPDSKPGDKKPSFLAFPEDGYIAFEIPNAMIPVDAARKGSTGMLLRFKSAEGFKNFLVGAMETAALVWPEIAQEWKDLGKDDS